MMTNVTELKEKELQRLIKQVTARAKKHYAKANVIHDVMDAKQNLHMLTVEAPPSILPEIAEIIQKSPRAILVSSWRAGGYFDWAAETYIKDADIVTFKL